MTGCTIQGSIFLNIVETKILKALAHLFHCLSCVYCYMVYYVVDSYMGWINIAN